MDLSITAQSLNTGACLQLKDRLSVEGDTKIEPTLKVDVNNLCGLCVVVDDAAIVAFNASEKSSPSKVAMDF